MFVRVVLNLLLLVLLITLLRYVIGWIVRGVAQVLAPGRSSPQAKSEPRAGGELKRDPVCGTFVPASSSVKRTVKGEVIHFCSAECRDKYCGSGH